MDNEQKHTMCFDVPDVRAGQGRAGQGKDGMSFSWAFYFTFGGQAAKNNTF